MTDVAEKYILIVSPGCYNITKSIYIPFIIYQPLLKYTIYWLT